LRRSWGILLLLLLIPVSGVAQLRPGAHYVMPSAGAQFATNDLLNVTTTYPPLQPGEPPGPLLTRTHLDPGIFTSARYLYAVNRKLALELELSWGVSVHVIEQNEINPGEPIQLETTTTDARITQGFLSLDYFMGPYYVTSPFVTVGLGTRSTNLRQRGKIDPDPIYNRAYMVGFGFMLVTNETLSFRFDCRDFMYNFYYDNQFADPALSGDVLGIRDIGIAVRAAEPRFQHDIVVTFGVQVKFAG
jgi:hypothetical protein